METKCQLRNSMFPGWPPMLNFLPPGETYEKTIPLDWLVWTLPSASSPLIYESIQRIGCSVKKNDYRQWEDKEGILWDHLLVSENSNPVNFYNFHHSVQINKFPGAYVLCRKDKLWQNYARMREKHGSKLFNFIPKTYNLPEDLKYLRAAMKLNERIFILKPVTGSCGYGIRLIKNIQDVPKLKNTKKKHVVVQAYVSNPFLINNLKFDIRLYVLVTNVDPLKIYLYQDGLVRFATQPYSNSEEHLNNKELHHALVVEKCFDIFWKNDFEYNNDVGEFSGHKWSLQMLIQYMDKQGYDMKKVLQRIDWLILKTIILGQQEMATQFKKTVKYNGMCYKLFGVDVMLDDQLKPWLLELNNFPSLEPPKLDRHVNEPMISEMFNIIGLHINQKLSNQKMSELKQIYPWKNTDVIRNPLLFSRQKTTLQVQKEDTTRGMIPEGYTQAFVKPENLTGHDVRILVQAEQELSQCKGFKRLYPKKDGSTYLRLLDVENYSDNLLHAWEYIYAERREEGRQLLKDLCQQNFHLQDLPNSTTE